MSTTRPTDSQSWRRSSWLPCPKSISLPAARPRVFAIAAIAAVAVGLGNVPALAATTSCFTAAAPSASATSKSTSDGARVDVQIPSGQTITSVAAGAFHSVAVAADGTVWAWGYNSAGQLGDGNLKNSLTPVQVKTPTNLTFTAVAAGTFYSLALASDGTVWAWGFNMTGQLGDGSTDQTTRPVRVQIPTNKTITAISAGVDHSLALASDGTVWTWGGNSDGQLGDGTTTASLTPEQVKLPNGTNVTAVAAGTFHSVVATGGGMYAWGANNDGQLGNGTTTQELTPVAVLPPTGHTITSLAAGITHTVALAADGSVWAWGSNTSGQLGDGSLRQSSTAVRVLMPAGHTVTAITAAGDHSGAMTADGIAWTWGDNTDGQLGNGNTTNSPTPIQVSIAGTIAGVSTGGVYSTAVAADGTVWGWGQNTDGQLGNGTKTNSLTPTQVVVSQPMATQRFGGPGHREWSST